MAAVTLWEHPRVGVFLLLCGAVGGLCGNRIVDVIRSNYLFWVVLCFGVGKLLAISTGQLHTLRCFHVRPINPMVCGGPSHLRVGNLILKQASRLDAFSGYPFRT